MKKRGIFVISIVMSVILAIIAFLYDKEIIKFVSSIRTDSLDYLFLSVLFISNAYIIFFFLTTLFLWNNNHRKWVLPLWFTSFFVIGIGYLMKIIIARPRPFQAIKGFYVLQIAFHFIRNNFNTWNFSFPSFQALIVFSALPILGKEFKKFRYIWFVFACLVVFSQVYFGIHYLSDVLGGAIIGYLIGLLMVKIEEKYGYSHVLMKRLGISR